MAGRSLNCRLRQISTIEDMETSPSTGCETGLAHEKQTLIDRLDSFDPAARHLALAQLLPLAAFPPSQPTVNMHCHSFFSFNARGYSPTRIAWEARERGLYAAAVCDFDVLDGAKEFIDAGSTLGLRAAAHIETRVFCPAYADKDINSPGEEGVAYIMGAGFAEPPSAGTEAKAKLDSFRAQAASRNRLLIERINAKLAAIEIDYDRDVVPLTPAGGATERHIVRAYVQKAHRSLNGKKTFQEFWSNILDTRVENFPVDEDRRLLDEARTKLVKRGGIGYQEPSGSSFPALDDFAKWVRSCGAIPMAAWLDGCSAGESNPTDLMDYMQAHGVLALNIIPDRNWNIPDPSLAERKRAKLQETVETAQKLHMPINIGTEMNKDGLPFADDLSGAALAPYAQAFLEGAQIIVGHSRLLRFADFSYSGDKADSMFGDRTDKKNLFFESVGRLPPEDTRQAATLTQKASQDALTLIADSARKQRWIV